MVRLGNPADNPEWCRLRCALWPSSTPEAHRLEMEAWLKRTDAVVIVAPRAEGGLCGFVEVGARSIADGCDSSPVAYLEGWFVDPDRRRQGIGCALVRAAETWARGRGYLEFASDAELDNLDGHSAHIGLGFIEAGRAVLYRKSL